MRSTVLYSDEQTSQGCATALNQAASHRLASRLAQRAEKPLERHLAAPESDLLSSATSATLSGSPVRLREMKTRAILILMFALPVFADTNTVIIRGLNRRNEVPESIRRLRLARDRLGKTQHSDEGWGGDTNRIIETSIALLGFGDLTGHWRYQSNIVAGAHWLLSQPVPKEKEARPQNLWVGDGAGGSGRAEVAGLEEGRELLRRVAAFKGADP